jgi:hypothetical protein
MSLEIKYLEDEAREGVIRMNISIPSVLKWFTSFLETAFGLGCATASNSSQGQSVTEVRSRSLSAEKCVMKFRHLLLKCKLLTVCTVV